MDNKKYKINQIVNKLEENWSFPEASDAIYYE